MIWSKIHGVCETEHFESLQNAALNSPRSPSAILPRISEDGVVVFLLSFFPSLFLRSIFLKHARVPRSFHCKNTPRGIQRDETVIIRITRLRTFSLPLPPLSLFLSNEEVNCYTH